MSTQPKPTPTPPVLPASVVIYGFGELVFSRSAVRLCGADYGFRQGATRSELEDARAAYRQDRNNIRRASRELEKAWAALEHRRVHFPLEHKNALIEASKLTRFELTENGWHYTTGQYQPTEIRWGAAELLRRAYRIIYAKPAPTFPTITAQV